MNIFLPIYLISKDTKNKIIIGFIVLCNWQPGSSFKKHKNFSLTFQESREKIFGYKAAA